MHAVDTWRRSILGSVNSRPNRTSLVSGRSFWSWSVDIESPTTSSKPKLMVFLNGYWVFLPTHDSIIHAFYIMKFTRSFAQAWKLHKRNQTLDMMDYSLAETADADQLAMCIHIALLCTQADPKLRPDMSRLVIILSKKKNTLLEQPTKPGFPGSSYGRSKLRQQGSSSHSHGRSSSSTSSHQTVSSSSNSSHGNR